MRSLCARPIRRLRVLRPIRSFSITHSRLNQIPISSPPSIPYVSSCPSPTCACAPMPPDLDIDRKTPLLNTMAAYSEQLVICTGKNDWTSRIEDEQSPSGDFVRGIKSVVGKGGEAFDPFNNVSTILSSLPSSKDENKTTALLFPSFLRIPSIPHSPQTYSAFASAYLKPRQLHPAHGNLSPEQTKALTRDGSKASELPPAERIKDITVLICGHGGRDQRCGILGPILREQFRQELKRKGITGEVGLISHIGGHKYAGNVIIYIPPGMEGPGINALNGTGIWYGRVEPGHVEGIVEETILKGRIVKDHFRGGIMRNGGNLGRLLEDQLRRESGDTGELKLKPRIRAR